MKPQHAGRYIARPIEWKVDNSKNGLPEFVCKFDFLHEQTSEGWIDIQADQIQFTGFFNLVYVKDGQPTLNNINIESLQTSLGWDGGSFKPGLSDGNWSGTEVQIVLDWEEYNGKSNLKIQYLNPRDYEGGGLKKASPEEVQSIEMKYGPLLRAASKRPGATTTGRPSPSSNRPAGSAAPAQARPAQPSNTKGGCWQAYTAMIVTFNKDHPGDAYTNEKTAQTFKSVLSEIFPGKDLTTLTPDEWQIATTRIEMEFSAATGGIIPF